MHLKGKGMITESESEKIYFVEVQISQKEYIVKNDLIVFDAFDTF